MKCNSCEKEFDDIGLLIAHEIEAHFDDLCAELEDLGLLRRKT